MSTQWSTSFLSPSSSTDASTTKRALIILNQPSPGPLLRRIWDASDWRCCADGGANRLHDALSKEERDIYVPDLIKGDLDSICEEVKSFYVSKGVSIVQDHDEYTTDLMKCVETISEMEKAADGEQHEIILLGGLSGRLDQTIHTLSYLHKLRKTRQRVFAVTEDSVGWVLDEGEHEIEIDHTVLGPTCGLLPVGVESTVLTTAGLKWNLNNTTSGFEGLVSTSNHLLPEEPIVRIKTSRPIWWCAELKTVV